MVLWLTESSQKAFEMKICFFLLTIILQLKLTYPELTNKHVLFLWVVLFTLS